MVSSNNAINNTVGASISGVTNTLTVTNPSNTASSAARTQITVGGTSSGDPTLNFNVSGATNWEMGIDNNDSDSFKISSSASLGTTDTLIMNTAGIQSLPLQPAFLAYRSTTASNVTGDSTNYTIQYDAESYDIQSNFSTPNFTAPVDGIYFFVASTVLTGVSSSHTAGQVYITGGGAVIYGLRGNPANIRDGSTLAINASGILRLTAGQTARVILQISNSTKTINVAGSALSTGPSTFAGFKLA